MGKDMVGLILQLYDSLRRGEIASVVLAGGMATRFGGVVKANVEVSGGRTFLDLKVALGDLAARRAGAAPPPLVAMTSFATDEAVRDALARIDSGPRLCAVPQFVSVRLTPRGEIFRTGHQGGEPSLYAPGHGDLPEAFLARGELDRLSLRGVRTLWVSNVDNLGATIDPVILGWHLGSGTPLGVEVCRRVAGEAGGAPALCDGRVQVIEGFRFPKEFDRESLPVFNTNTLLVSIEALRTPAPLDFFVVHKTVGGQTAVQFERLIGQLSAFLPTGYLRVERDGPESRFVPVKEPADLARAAEAASHLLGPPP